MNVAGVRESVVGVGATETQRRCVVTELLPTIPGSTPGIVDLDPFTLQCGVCGVLAVKPEGQRIAPFILLARFLFCLNEPGVRRCPDCRKTHQVECARCRR